jgi:serine/threonine protein kinase/Flp pilus assembly protein TadD
MTLSEGTRLGRYEIRSQIGAGGMGEVYLAQDTKLDRKVALKILPADLASNSDRMERFIREAKSAAALNHPNIAHIYEIGESDGVNFIAMEFIDGVTLREKIHRERADLRKLLKVLQQVAEGLSKAHAAGIVHRDLKPDNIMITRDGFAKVLDFGLAKLVEKTGPELDPSDRSNAPTNMMQQGSLPGMVMGTVGYMSPEQAQGKTNEIDQRSDIFSFGCILYEAVTGHKAFAGKDTIDSLNKIIRESPPPLTDFRPDTPNHLQRIVRRCLAKDPEDRYQTIKDVAIELRELRRELTDTGLESTVPPPRSETTAGANARSTSLGSPLSTSSPSQGSSVEYVVAGIKRHKVAMAAVFLILIAAAIGLAAFLRARYSEVAIDSIAVMPFVNETNDSNSEYLSDGLTESIINNLIQLPSLRVSPRSSVFHYKGKDTDPIQIAKELGVRAVLTGRMSQRGENLIISAELLDTRDNKQIWGDQYNRKVADALAVQHEISREITDRLRTKLRGEEQKQLTRRDTSNPEAYQFYLKGRHYWNKRTTENLKKSIEQFQQAVDKDPNYALAFVGLADCYLLLEDYGGTPASETFPKAKTLAERALQLDASLSEAHTSLGYIYNNLWEWDQAEKESKRAIEMNPNYPNAHFWYALYLQDVGRFDEALIEAKRAYELDPLSLTISSRLATNYLLEGDVNASIAQCKRAIDLDPSFPRAHTLLGFAYLKQGNYADALTELQKGNELTARTRFGLASLGYGYALGGERAEALAILKEIQEKYDKHEALGQDMAAVYAGLGDKDQAFAWLEKDFQARSGLLSRVRWESSFDSLHSDPRFTDLLRRMGLKA